MRENLIIAVLIILILFLLIKKTSRFDTSVSGIFVSSSMSSTSSSFTIPALAWLSNDQSQYIQLYMNRPNSVDTMVDFCQIAENQINGVNSYTLMNKYLPPGMLQYSSDSELNSVFDDAYINGEPSGTSAVIIRDRTMLHIVAYIFINTLYITPGALIDIPENGRSTGFDVIQKESGKTDKELLLSCFEYIKNVNIPLNLSINFEVPISVFNYLNSALPSYIKPYPTPADVIAIIPPNDPSSDAARRGGWFSAVCNCGTLYIVFLVKNKWKIDMNWIYPGSPITNDGRFTTLNFIASGSGASGSGASGSGASGSGASGSGASGSGS